MKLWKQAACAVLSAALLLSAGCSENNKSWAYRAGDVQPPVGVYIYNMLNSVTEVEQKLLEEHEGDGEYEISAYRDMLKEAMADGTVAADYIRAQGERKTREYIAVEQKFAELGLTLTESDLLSAQSTAENAWSADPGYNTNGVAEDSLRLIIENSQKRQALFASIYGPEGSDPVSESELQEQMKKEYVKMDYLMAAKDMGEGADNSALKAAMEGYRDRIADGEDMYDIIREHEQAEADKNAAEGETPAQISRPEPGSRTMILYEGYRSYYGDELVDGALAAAVGEPVVIEDEYTYYLVLRHDILEDPADLEEYRDTLLQTLKGEEFEQMVAGWGAALNVEANQAALDKYTPSRLTVQDHE